jgi:iron complex transport system ATP-binding protein
MHLRDRAYTTLSGGERQRVQLARVLAQLDLPRSTEARMDRLLFLDEPISALDIRHQCRILSLAKAAAEEGIAVLAVLHDLNFALRFGDRLLLLREGRIQHDLAPEKCTESILEEIFQIQLRAVSIAPSKTTQLFFPEAPTHLRK